MSTYSPSLRIELITTGDQAGTWGATTNTNLGTLIEQSISGFMGVAITSTDQALVALYGAEDEARNATIALTTALSTPFNVYAPPAEKTYIIFNASLQTATIYNSTIIGNTTAAGVGVAIPAGKTVTVWSDGYNFRSQVDHLPSLTLGSALPVSSGGTGSSTASGARTNLGLGTMATQDASNVAITGGSITNITDLAVADGGTGASTPTGARANLGAAASGANADITSLSGLTTALSVSQGGTGATTAAAARTSLGLGTIATQNSNSVSITGGSITGITDLAVADGGTGASDAATARSNLGVPSTTGSGASGTWSINISGNAATASSASYATTAGNGGVTSVNGSTGAVTVTSIGVGQSWVDVTGSRALNTSYTNTTGRPIQVTCSAKSQSAGNPVVVIVGGVTILNSYTQDCCGVPQNSFFPMSFIVPAGSTYQINGNLGFSVWAELR